MGPSIDPQDWKTPETMPKEMVRSQKGTERTSFARPALGSRSVRRRVATRAGESRAHAFRVRTSGWGLALEGGRDGWWGGRPRGEGEARGGEQRRREEALAQHEAPQPVPCHVGGTGRHAVRTEEKEDSTASIVGRGGDGGGQIALRWRKPVRRERRSDRHRHGATQPV